MINPPPPSARAQPADTTPGGGQARSRVHFAPGSPGIAVAALALVLGACSPAADRSATLEGAELRTVVAELDAMARRPDRAADGLVARNATPERIDRFFRTPELTTQSFEVRRQALALAGQGSTLGFERPSDVLNRMMAWFPERFGTPQARKGRLDTAANRLYGPYPGWNAEATAFMALWECMPEIAWEEPDANPFRQRSNDNSFVPLAATSSTERDFRNCVFTLSGEPDYLDKRRSREAAQARAEAIGNTAARVLRQKFDAFLQADGCSGKGPDDCVLVMWMWASLDPADTRLAETLRWLEPAVRPTGEPPPLSKPAEEYGPGPQENNEPRFDEAIRKAAFLRSKLNAILLGPANWPPDARSTAFGQLARLQAWFDANVDQRWQQRYALERQHDAINPWQALGQGSIDGPALLDELDALPADADCATRAVWFRHGGPALAAGHLLRHLRRTAAVACGGPDWAWLAQGEAPASMELRGQYIQALDDLRSGFAYEAIIDGLLAGCVPLTTAEWARQACARRVSQPMPVPATTRRHLLSGAATGDWPGLPLPPPTRHGEATAAAFADQAEWLRQLALPHGPEAAAQAARLAADLELRGSLIHGAAGWRAPAGGQSLAELILWPPLPGLAANGVALQASRIVVLLGADSLRTVSVPSRFGFRDGDGHIGGVTDIDGDGSPEVWFAGAAGECDSEGQRPGVDCTIPTMHMGEVRSEVLSYFRDDRPAPPAAPTARPH